MLGVELCPSKTHVQFLTPGDNEPDISGNRIFTDVINHSKMRSYDISVGPQSKMTNVLTRRDHILSQKKRRMPCEVRGSD